MKTLIIYASIHHQNTFKIAQVLAKILKANLKKVNEVEPEEVTKYDLVGFGSGIYMWKHHQSLLDLIDRLFFAPNNTFARVNNENFSVSEPTPKDLRDINKGNGGVQASTNEKNFVINPRLITKFKNAFIFSTSGAPGGIRLHKILRDKLINKGFKIIGEFNCKAWDTFGALKLIGGLNKGHPDKQDLNKAQVFAHKLRQSFVLRN